MKRFFRLSWLSFKALYGYLDPKIYILMMVINPLLQLIFFSYMVRYAYGTTDISPWIIGNAFLIAAYSSVYIIGTLINGERREGTLELVVTSPANQLSLFITRSIFHIFDIVIRVLLSLLIGAIIFDFNINTIYIPKLIISMITGMLSGVGFGLLIGSLGFLMSDIHLFLNSVEQILIVFTGALFPISRLPNKLQYISKIVPMTRSLKATKLLLSNSTSGFYNLIVQDITLTVLYIIIGFLVFKICFVIARKKGTMNFY